MRTDPDGTIWLKPEEWIFWLWDNRPERLFDVTAKRPTVSEREESQQWRRGRGQGILAAPISPSRIPQQRKAAGA
jgi:hypothetical protein